MALVSSGIFWLSVPRSGLASTATTRSPRREANVAPKRGRHRGLADTALQAQHRDLVAAEQRLVDPRGQLATADVGRALPGVDQPPGQQVEQPAPAGLRGGRLAGRSSRAEDRSGRAAAPLRARWASCAATAARVGPARGCSRAGVRRLPVGLRRESRRAGDCAGRARSCRSARRRGLDPRHGCRGGTRRSGGGDRPDRRAWAALPSARARTGPPSRPGSPGRRWI